MDRAAREISSLEAEAFKQKTIWEREHFLFQQAHHRYASWHLYAGLQIHFCDACASQAPRIFIITHAREDLHFDDISK